MATITKSGKMGQAKIGPASWSNDTTKTIKVSQSYVGQNDKTCTEGKSTNPLPNLREMVAELSNDEAHQHFRETRAVVYQLRESLIDTNEEMKSLTRGKEALEKAIENVRKDLKLNQQSQDVRKCRPQREKDHDGADDLLQAEKAMLQNQKRQLETQHLRVQQHLLILDKARKRLADVISERSRVLDLACHALPGGSVSAGMYTSRRSSRSRVCMSADFSRTEPYGTGPDPLGAFTPEIESALQDAGEARARSAMLRKDIRDTISNTDRIQKGSQRSVNSGLVGKIGETVGLRQSLDMAVGENRHAINRAHRWYDQTEKSWLYSRGPLSASDMLAREKLDRPIIRVFQRHPGTDLPEAQEIVKGGDGLLQSLQTTSRNIGLMKLAQLRLKDDLRDKRTAQHIDSAVLRMRRRKSDHRWVMGAAY